MYWGFLQEKIVTTTYWSDDESEIVIWRSPPCLNLFMAISAGTVAFVASCFRPSKPVSPLVFFWASASCVSASPMGYIALRYISFPLLMLTKAAKPIPIMILGIFFFGQRYSAYKYIAVALLIVGISIFSMHPRKQHIDIVSTDEKPHQLVGACVVSALAC